MTVLVARPGPQKRLTGARHPMAAIAPVRLMILMLLIAAGVMMIFNWGVAAFGISVMLGLQVLVAGIALLVLSFAKKALMGKIGDSIQSLKARI